jgi:protocatechuate 3,4-dioxygenase beta subunit
MLNRRTFLTIGAGSSALVLLGCPRGRKQVAAPHDDARLSTALPTDDKACVQTADNIEGPFYRSGSPSKVTLVESTDAGQRLELAGSVRNLHCAAIAGATLDIWQANDRGDYDNRGYHFRGRLQTSDDGTWRISTIVPGRYLNGSQFRPAHIHVKLSASGYADLTTQLYFPGDPYNAVDSFIKPSLLLDVKPRGATLDGGYDFVLKNS